MYPIELHPQLDLANPIVDVATSTRQMNTVSAILNQFDTFPGVILADEVGMGRRVGPGVLRFRGPGRLRWIPPW